ncbi:protein of unknown function [Bradyrhizobium vignae]|uniref:Uncharacterized protein n=1 Tax=Bradyrhizobium vignae TaxID=1549949 RepID=A0A2U3Q8H2_9BRAD|nr:protein of unknown function [Bradyrhizobium vignae]
MSSRAPSLHSNVTAIVAQFEQTDSKSVGSVELALTIIILIDAIDGFRVDLFVAL